jgi:hypothetical protein
MNKDTYGDCEIDTLYVYVGENTLIIYLTTHSKCGGGTIEYHITIDLTESVYNHPYPESKIK